MKFKNKKTGQVIEPKDYVQRFMCINNSNFEEVKEEAKDIKTELEKKSKTSSKKGDLEDEIQK